MKTSLTNLKYLASSLSVLALTMISFALTGCATHANNPADPLEGFNRSMDKFNDTVDKTIAKPIAKGYDAAMPLPGKIMVGNFFSNLDDVIVTANDLLQFKFKQGFSDAMRVLVNSTVGIGGLFDLASMRLPKHNEDFGQTLGYWGVGPGPYLVLPLLGPSTIRDGTGLYADGQISRLRNTHRVPMRNQLYLLKVVNKRAALLKDEKVLDEAAIDRYAFIRDAYLLRRKNLVYDGNPPDAYDEYDFEEEDTAPPAESSPVPAEPAATQESDNPPGETSMAPGTYKVWLTSPSS